MTRMRLTTGAIIAATFIGHFAGMSAFVSFPALQPVFQRLWTLRDSEAGFISGIYFAGYVVAVPLATKTCSSEVGRSCPASGP